MTYGVQGDGSFWRKHVDTIRDDMRAHFRNELGGDVELRDGSPQQQLLDAKAIELARLWQSLESVYYTGFYEDAFGDALSKHLALPGVDRLPLRPATGVVVFSRDEPASDDIDIPEETVVTTTRTETRPRIPFETTEPALIGEGELETDRVAIEALKPWQSELDEEWLGEATNVDAGEITEATVARVDSVSNPVATGDTNEGFTRGRDRETDAEFRLRYRNEFGADGKATLPAIEATIFNVDPGIEDVRVDERHDDAADEYGVEPVVLAPNVDDAIVAEAILDSRAGGLDSYGPITTSIEYAGETRSVGFARATKVDVHADITVTVSDEYPDDGATRIEDALIAYIGGVDSSDVRRTGLVIGEDVVYDQTVKRVLGVDGVVELDVTIGDDSSNLGTSNIAIANDETARVENTNIAITENQL